MKTTIYTPDIECESCEKLLTRAFAKQQGIQSFDVQEDRVIIEHEPYVGKESLVDIIKKQQFRASLEPYERMTFKERMAHMKQHKQLYTVERKIIWYTIGLFLLLSGIEALAYMAGLRIIDGFGSRFGLWLGYLNLSVAIISVASWHYLAYKVKITCMTGMMIGMTFGMQTGMMIGAILGATNGFFVGAMTGMLLGSAIGALTGKCCGVMGVMEGIMAGVMGGTMGPMISVMMLSDHLKIFMPFYMILNIIIVWGLSYMLYEEVVEGKTGVKQQPISFVTLTSVAIIATLILMNIMIWGPKAGFIA